MNSNYSATDAACLYWSFVPSDSTKCEGQNLCAKFPGLVSVEVATGNDANLTVSGHYPGPRLEANSESLPCPSSSASQPAGQPAGSVGGFGRHWAGRCMRQARRDIHLPPKRPVPGCMHASPQRSPPPPQELKSCMCPNERKLLYL